jgi:hypothetical protein
VWYRLWHVDWRVRAVLVAVLASVIVTGFFYYFHIGLDPATHFGAVFASWVGGVALFVVAGAVVAIVSLTRPEEEPYDARARILFRRKTGSHIDYIINRIGTILEQYAETQVLSVRIEKYHDTSKTFYLTIANETIIRGYIDDIDSTYVSQIEYNNITLPPPGEAENFISFVRVKGQPVGGRETFSDHIHRDITTVVTPKESCKAEFTMSFWTRANDETNSQESVRYTQLFRLEVENLLDRPVKFEIHNPQRGRWDQVIINPLEAPKPVHTMADLRPGIKAVEYRLLEP